MANLTVDRNLKKIGPGIDESGIALSELEPGDVVEDRGGGEYDVAPEDFQGTPAVVLNEYPPEDDVIEADSGIKVRVSGMAIVETATDESVNSGDLVASAGNGKVKAITETEVTGVGSESADGSLLGQALSTAIGVAKTTAAEEEELVIKML
ncbi:MAG: hypothetical protein ACLFU5_04930 [Thermoplasmata archaeon]